MFVLLFYLPTALLSFSVHLYSLRAQIPCFILAHEINEVFGFTGFNSIVFHIFCLHFWSLAMKCFITKFNPNCYAEYWLGTNAFELFCGKRVIVMKKYMVLEIINIFFYLRVYGAKLQ